MDTLKERASLEALLRSGQSPWMLWRDASRAGTLPAGVEPGGMDPVDSTGR
jgi:hypothetical protein